MKAIIIDDKKDPKEVLINLLGKYCSEIEILATAENVAEGIKTIQKYEPQLVFLDVEMPDGTGFDLLEKIGNISFKVIFTTGYEKYAIKAFKFSAVDYLLKPVDVDDLINAVKKAKVEIKNEVLQLKVGTLLSNIQEFSDTLKKIVLRDAESLHIVQVAEIIRLEASDNYSTFYLTENRQILISKSLKEYENLLSQAGFFRCHQSHLINLNAMQRFDKRDGGVLVMNDDSKVPISKRKKEELFALLETL